MIVKTHFIQTRQTQSETKTISVRLSTVPTITYSGSVDIKPLIHRVGVSDVSALPLFLTSNAVNSFSGLIHCVQAEKQNSNWFPNEPFFQTTNKKTKDLLRKTNQNSLKKTVFMSPMKERTMKTTILLATRSSLLQNTLCRNNSHVWIYETHQTIDHWVLYFLYFCFACKLYQCYQCLTQVGINATGVDSVYHHFNPFEIRFGDWKTRFQMCPIRNIFRDVVLNFLLFLWVFSYFWTRLLI